MDWVPKRYECSLHNVFAKLREVVMSDVDSANKLDRPGVRFSLDKLATGRTKVIVDRSVKRSLGDPELSSVVFDLAEDRIKIRTVNPDTDLFDFRPRLSRDGECMMAVTGEADLMHLWQVSQKALDGLFFSI